MKLVFVYNAEAGLIAGILDSIHKTIAPQSYDCSLCAVTHGALTMDRRWRAYLKSLPLDTVFHHRADFRTAYPGERDLALPLVAVDEDGKLNILLDRNDLKEIGSADELIATLDERLAAIGSKS